MTGPIRMIEDDGAGGAYRAGACNIGPDEIRVRRAAGTAGIGVTILFAGALIYFGGPPILRLLVALPLAGGLIGFEQARRRFCLNFAYRGVWNFGKVGGGEQVTDAAAHAADLRAARTMIVQVGIVSAAIALVFALAPI